MADVIRGKFGVKRPPTGSGWRKYQAQEPETGGDPELERLPDQDIREIGSDDEPDVSDVPEAPPFTGEDVEHGGPPPQKRQRANPNVDLFI